MKNVQKLLMPAIPKPEAVKTVTLDLGTQVTTKTIVEKMAAE